MADPKREALLCRTSAFSSWLCHCLSGPVGESLPSLLLFKRWVMVFSSLPSVVAQVCLDLLFVYSCNANHCLSLVARNLGNCSDLKIISMEDAFPCEKLQPWEKFGLSESDLRKPWCVAWVIQIFVVLVKMSWSSCHTLKLLFFSPSFPPAPVLQLHHIASLWFYEWNVMICICIKLLSLNAPSALKTFMEVNLGKEFFAISDIFLPLYFSCPIFMWKVCTKRLIYKNMYTHHSHRQSYYNVFFLEGKSSGRPAQITSWD